MTTEQQMLDKWKEEYIDFPNACDITFEGYKELAINDGFRMGYCQCVWYSTSDRLMYMNAKITLDDDHSKCPTIFRDAVLWHEFCHAWEAFEFTHVDHCIEFQKKKWKKPKYALADVLLKLIGWVWFD